MSHVDRLNEVKAALSEVGPGFCLAKWNQVTIHLGTGLNHSCHHPAPHKIDEKDAIRRPVMLHCTKHKRMCWKQMLEGKRPAECDYCWNIEDNSKEFSDRIYKSEEPWAWNTLEKVKNSYWLDDYYPTYVELSFSNRCNYKCLYCSPSFSSRWQAEAKQYGPYQIPQLSLDGPIESKYENWCNHIELNPLVQSFWKWWPDLFKHLHTFRLTGGEPLLVEESYQILKYIQEHYEENPDISLSINTNLGLSDEKLEELIEIVRDLTESHKVKDFTIYTSIESEGEQAEYVRFGLDTEKFWKRVDYLLQQLPKIRVSIMATYNILSIFSFDKVVDRIYELKKKYDSKYRPWENTCISLDTSYLRWPHFLDVRVGNDKVKEIVENTGKRIADENIFKRQIIPIHDEFNFPRIPGFDELEIGKVCRISDYLENKVDYNQALHRKQLIAFLEEADKRRGTNFREVFPELEQCLC